MSGIPFSDDVSGRVMYNHVKDTRDINQFYIFLKLDYLEFSIKLHAKCIWMFIDKVIVYIFNWTLNIWIKNVSYI